MKSTATKAVAFSGVSSAAACLILLFAGWTGLAALGLAALAGCALTPVVVRFGWKYGFLAFAATSLVSFLITPGKYPPFLFAAFFGFYPVVKDLLETYLQKRLFSVLVKLVFFNLCFAVDSYAVGKLFAINIYEVYPQALVIFGANIIFLCYDYAFTLLTREITRRFENHR